jgi:hypothetical protein
MQDNINGKITFAVKERSHGNHFHINIVHPTDKHASGLKSSDEGCPCCAIGVDLDEVAAAASEMGKEGNTTSASQHSSDHGGLGGSLADFSSGAHWGMFAFSGAFAILGLTASVRNIKGTLNTDFKLYQELAEIKRQLNKRDCKNNKNLIAYKNSLEYSRSDTAFNFWVPGLVNGIASSMVLSSVIWKSPWALPFISFYAACQTVKNLYDLERNWNEIIACPDGASDATKAGIAKINEITKAKRLFYSANAAGFLVFTAGGIALFLSTSGITPSSELMIAGIILLVIGSLSTAVMNNIWTTKFKPRNGNLGVGRLELDADKAYKEIGKRQKEKKVLTTYRKTLMEKSNTDGVKKFGYKLLTSLPFCEQKGTELIHQLNSSNYKSAINKKDSSINNNNKRLEMLKDLYKASTSNTWSDTVSNQTNTDILKQALNILKALNLETFVIDKFIKNHVLPKTDWHDTSIQDMDQYLKQLNQQKKYFKVSYDKHKHADNPDHHNSEDDTDYDSDTEQDSHINEHEHEHVHNDDRHNCKHGSNCESDKKKDSRSEQHKHKHKNANLTLNVEQMNDKGINNFMESIEEYLIFDRVESLKYQIYGLNDYYWELDKVNKVESRINSKDNSSKQTTSKGDTSNHSLKKFD